MKTQTQYLNCNNHQAWSSGLVWESTLKYLHNTIEIKQYSYVKHVYTYKDAGFERLWCRLGGRGLSGGGGGRRTATGDASTPLVTDIGWSPLWNRCVWLGIIEGNILIYTK